MKRLLTILIVTVYLVACSSSSSQLESGNYDAAMQKSAKKIKKKPGDFEEVDTFNAAYKMAYEKDDAEIKRLINLGDPANWGKIYSIYVRMNKRQDLAASLPPVGINYKERDYNSDISTARTNATEYAYNKGIEFLNKGNQYDARKAYDKFNEAKRYDASYKDLTNKLAEAKRAGMTNAYFRIDDNTAVKAPQKMMESVQAIKVDDLDKGWTNFDSYIDTSVLYHYSMILNLQLIEVSPEAIKETSVTESKEVKDGFEYVLDANGNVTKDSLGNDVKVPKFKTITCTVQRFEQNKTVRLTGMMEYYEVATGKKLKSEPIVANAAFSNKYALATGNQNALKPTTKKELQSKPLPFPKDVAMIFNAGEILKKLAKENIVRNKGLVK